MSSDDRKDYRRKNIQNKKAKKENKDYEDFSYSKIRSQYKQKKRHLLEQEIEDEIDEYS